MGVYRNHGLLCTALKAPMPGSGRHRHHGVNSFRTIEAGHLSAHAVSDKECPARTEAQIDDLGRSVDSPTTAPPDRP